MNSAEHVVFFPASDGSPAFRRLSSLHEAVDFVEHLRNEQGMADVSVHSLAEVPLAFRTVYRVEVAGAVPAPAEPPAAEVAETAAPVADAPIAEAPVAEAPVEPMPAEAVDVPAEVMSEQPASNGEVVGAGVDGHSLGFFAG